MKAVPVEGTYKPTILSAPNIAGGADASFSEYHTVPEQYTKIATFNSTTTETIGSSFYTTYRAYISRSQPAGTYSGKVRYTLVHPASNIPDEPKDCGSNKICYWPNAGNTVVDSMGDQTVSANSEVTLWASNFKREGYGFAGWSDKYDWELNQNDENGNGTGSNAGYHIYGPNQTITTPSDLVTKGLSLYAVWVKSTGNLQGWTGCSAMSVGEITALTDTRNNDTYAIAKLKDNNCWMIENLRLGGASPIKLTTNDTDIESDITLPATMDNLTTSYGVFAMNADNTLYSVDNMVAITEAVYSYGNYYSWSGAIGRSLVNNTYGQVVNTSICPKGWRLPLGNYYTVSPDKSFSNLDYVMGGSGTNQNNAQQNNRWRTYPNNYIIGGRKYNNLPVMERGSRTWYWTASTGIQDNSLYIDSVNNIFPGTSDDYAYQGFPVRCLVD